MEYFIQGILSFIKFFEIFGDLLFYLSGIMYIPYPPDPEKRKKETTINQQPLSILIKGLIINNIQFNPRFFHRFYRITNKDSHEINHYTSSFQ